MQYKICVLLAVTVLARAQRVDPLQSFRNSDSVLFATYNVDKEKGFIEFAPADPDDQNVDSDDFLNTTTLIFTKEGFVAEYWGLTSSHHDGKIWMNNYRRAALVEYDVNANELKTAAKDLTDGLENLAYDRVTKVLYWTDSIEKSIFAMEKRYRHFTTVYKSATVSPYALALHTVKRKLFFSVYKLSGNFISNTELIKCDLDGGNQETILRFPKVIRPRGLTIDYSKDKLFWTDMSASGESVVMASDLDGTLPRQFFAKPRGFLWGIAHYRSYIYVTDIVNTTVNEYDIHIRNVNGRRGTTLKTKLRPRNVDIYGPNEVSKEKVTNECDVNRCDHLCLASSRGNSVCRCSPGYQLRSGSRCDTSPLEDDYLVIADVGQKRLFQVPIKSSSSGDDIIAIPTDDLTKEKIYAFAVGPKSGDLAWYDLDNKQIVWGDKTLSFSETVSSIAFHCCEDKIFIATTSEIFSWDGKARSADSIYVLSFFSNSEVRQVVVDCVRDQLYWVEYDSVDKTSKVRRSDLNGRDVENVLKNLPVSKGITIQRETYTLHVMSMLEGVLYSLPLKILEKIPSTDPNYFQYSKEELKLQFGTRVQVIFDIKVKDGFVYLADSEASHLWRFNLRRGASSLEAYGPKKLFFAATIDFYDDQYYGKHLAESCDEEFPEPTRHPFVPVTPRRRLITTAKPKPTVSGINCVQLLTNLLDTADFFTAFAAYMKCLNSSI